MVYDTKRASAAGLFLNYTPFPRLFPRCFLHGIVNNFTIKKTLCMANRSSNERQEIYRAHVA